MMTFASGSFLVFIIVVFILYFLVAINKRWIILLIASAIFYLGAGLNKLPFILLASLASYYTAIRISKVYEKQNNYLKEHEISKEETKQLQTKNKKKCKIICLIGIGFILAMLIYTKTGNWILNSIQNVIQPGAESKISIIVPLGISYYTFSAIGYLADVYWKKEKAEKNYFKFLLFVLYFPKILQGPISRHKNLGKQLVEGHRFEYKRFCYGLQLMLWGYFKKLVIADRLAIPVSKVFGSYATYSGSILLTASLLAAVQLYCDFSGYMDIALGISQVFGIELEKNFDHPFFSRSAAEFWRRWHITLGMWFKDYVYMPLVVSPRMMKLTQRTKQRFSTRAGKTVMTSIPLAVVWLLTGIWHGTGWSYVVWGIYWGVLIILSSALEPEIKRLTSLLKINVQAGSWKVFQMARTFLLFCIGRIITIPGDLHATGVIAEKIFTDFQIWQIFDGTLYSLGLDAANFNLAMITILVLWAVSRLQNKGSVRERIAGCNIVFRWAIYYIAIFAVLIFGIYGPGYDASAFVYMQF